MKIVFLLCFFVTMSFAADRYPFSTPGQSARFLHLTEALRCLVCQNESIADSNAALADDIRKEIYEKMNQGATDQMIVSELVSRYGDFVRFNPPFNSKTYFLWYAPFVIFILGFVILFLSMRKHR